MPSESAQRFGVIFDLDDTLISTSPVYYRAFTKMMLQLYEDTIPHFIMPEEVIEVYDLICQIGSKKWEIDSTTPGIHSMTFDDVEGMDSSRDISDFPRKLVDTYLECCLRAKTMPDKENIYKVHNMANRMLANQNNYPTMPNATKLVNYLIHRENVRLFLITAGPIKLQSPKIRNRKMFRYFDEVFILSDLHKKGERIKELQQRYDDVTMWIMIGDSVPIDINPAIGNGCVAIHVLDNQCHLAKGELLCTPDSKRLYVPLSDLGEVYDYLARGLLNAKSKVPFEERARSLLSVESTVS